MGEDDYDRPTTQPTSVIKRFLRSHDGCVHGVKLGLDIVVAHLLLFQDGAYLLHVENGASFAADSFQHASYTSASASAIHIPLALFRIGAGAHDSVHPLRRPPDANLGHRWGPMISRESYLEECLIACCP